MPPVSRLTRFLATTLIAGILATQASAFELKWVWKDAEEEAFSTVGNAALLGPLSRQDDADAQDILGAAQADYARLIAALYDEGYYAPVIAITLDGREAATFSPVSPPSQVGTVTITITTGPRFSFGQAQISPRANDDPLTQGFSSGEPAKLTIIRDAVGAEVDHWRDAGHAKADVASQQIAARHPQQELDVRVVLDPGPQLRFGTLVLTNDSAVRTDRLIDIAGLPTGQRFSPDELDRVAARLRRTGTFDVVALSEADSANADGTLDIELQTTDRLPRRFGFGAEISSQEGLELSGFWLHRNLLGGAERLRIEADVGGIGGQSGGEDYELGARFSRPATFNEDTDFFIETNLERLNEPSFTSRKFSVEAGIKRYATPRREYTFAIGYERARTTDALGEEDYTILTAPATVQFDYRDDTLNPKEGYFALASAMPYIGLDGTPDGAVLSFDGRAYYTLPQMQALTLALRTQIGTVLGPDVEDAPADFLFFSGGGGTVRGQEYQSLGIDLGGGSQIGGNAFLGLSVEARYALNDTLGVVAFFDTGFIGSEGLGDTSAGDWHSGAGLGVRYDTGIGPIRFDVAVPIDRPQDASSFQVYIGIGQSF